VNIALICHPISPSPIFSFGSVSHRTAELMTEPYQFTRPGMRLGAGFHTDQTLRDNAENGQNLAATQLQTNDNTNVCINTVY